MSDALAAARRDLRLGLAVSFLLTVGVVAGVMVVPLYDMHLFDRVLTGRSLHTLIALSLIALVGLGLYALLVAVRGALLATVAERVLDGLHGPAVTAGLRAAVGADGRVVARTLDDLQEMRRFLSGPAAAAPFDLMLSPIVLGTLFVMHAQLGWFALASASALIAIGLTIDSLCRPRLAAARARFDTATARVGAMLREPVLAEGLGLGPRLAAQWRRDHASALAALGGALSRGEGWSAVGRLVRALAQGGLITLAAILVLRGEASPGLLVGANLMLALMLNPLDQLLAHWRAVVAARLAWRRLSALAACSPPLPGDGVAPAGEGIVFRDVAFRPVGFETPVVSGVSCRIAPGEIVALGGANGAGKSTLLRLAGGVIEPTAGTIAVAGLPASVAAAAGLVGYLPQRPQILPATVAETVARFRDSPAEAIVAAARAAGLHGIVGRLPQGYATPTGQGDPQFSDGQRQRLAFARALFGDPPVLVLDEPETGLDHEGEGILIDALLAAKARGAAILLATHRARLIGLADRVWRLSAGRVEAEPTVEAA